MGKELGLKDQVYINPDLALHRDTSVAILAQGMIKGLFTGKRLSQYFNNSTTNWGGARRIVNGLDKYKLIGGYGRKFHATLRTIPSGTPIAKDDCTSATIPQSCLNKLTAQLATLNTEYEGLNTIYKNTLSDMQKLQTTITAQQQEIADLKAKLPGTTDALANLQQKFQELEGRFTQVETENNKNKTDNTKLIAANKDLQTKLDDAITTGSTGQESDLLKTRLEQLEQDQKALNQKLAQVADDQQKLSQLSTSLSKKQTALDAQTQDIEISRQALQARESNLLTDNDQLIKREKIHNEERLQLASQEESLKRSKEELDKEKRAFEDYKSQTWYSRAWNKVSSTWRKE